MLLEIIVGVAVFCSKIVAIVIVKAQVYMCTHAYRSTEVSKVRPD